MGDFLVQQLIYQAPLLLVSFLGGILGLVYWARCPAASILTILGCGILILTAVGYTAAHTVLWERMRAGELPNEQVGRLMSLLGLVSSGTRALGLALVVVAVFVGRRRPRAERMGE